MAEKKCTRCGVVKDTAEFHANNRNRNGLRAVCKACCSAYVKARKHDPQAIAVRRAYASKPERMAAAREHARQRDKGKRRDERERAAAKQGRAFVSRRRDKPSDKILEKLAVSNAVQAWGWWIKVKAPNWWLDQYYAATGKPWNDPRISLAEKYTMRYQLDAEFRARQRERQRLYKFTHPEVVAAQDPEIGNRRRWNQAAIQADGTVTKFVIRRLTRQRNCAYCLTELTASNRQIDHITPLSKGGIHGEANLVACCAKCNMSKGASKLWQWSGLFSG